MEIILGLIMEYAVELIAAIILLFLPSPAGRLKKILIFIKEVIEKILEKLKK